MITLKRIQSSDQNLMLIQDNVQTAFNVVTSSTTLTKSLDSKGNTILSRTTNNNPFNEGNLFTVSLITAQDNLVQHGLNRIPVVFVICGLNANSVIWTKTTTKLANNQGVSQSSSTNFINLVCSANCTATIWFN